MLYQLSYHAKAKLASGEHYTHWYLTSQAFFQINTNAALAETCVLLAYKKQNFGKNPTPIWHFDV
ncbi:hypothetical protein B0189_04850 [Moraxella cuniculi]|nr:hypothetical protein B0189_04850 [Moraxella cuniculi]